jgi:hypothetical protein
MNGVRVIVAALRRDPRNVAVPGLRGESDLQDAGDLCQALVDAATGNRSISEAISGYGAIMRPRGLAAVPAAPVGSGGGPFRALLRLAARLPRRGSVGGS